MRLRMTALMISLVLLCGCASASADRERVETLRSRVAKAAQISFKAELIADDGEARERYVLLCTWTDGDTELRLLYPELIGGVTAHIKEENAALTYDGLSFEMGAVDANGLSPMLAPVIVLSALRTGVVSQLRREERGGTETIAFRVLCTNGYYTDLWIDAQTLAPCCAEILSGERAALRCTLTEWNTKEG